MRGIILKIHLLLALAAGVFLIVGGVTGAILALEAEIDRWLNPRLFDVTPRGDPQPLSAMAAAVEKEFAGQRAAGVRLPPRADLSYEIALRDGRLAYLDPYTGRLLGTRRRDDMLTVKIHNLHTRLLAGEAGRKIIGWAAVVLFLLAVSGLVLWWRQKLFSFRSKGPWTQVIFDVHQVTGLYSFFFLLLFAWTGCVISFEDALPKFILRATNSPDPPAVPNSFPAPAGARPITSDEALRIAREALPGATATLVSIPGGPRASIRVTLKFPEDRTPAGRSRVYIDQYSGRILLLENTRQQPLGVWYLNKNRSLHTGDIWGAPSRVVAAVASFLIAMQVVTGVLIWWRNRPRRA